MQEQHARRLGLDHMHSPCLVYIVESKREGCYGAANKHRKQSERFIALTHKYNKIAIIIFPPLG